jgi:hypothetical protein
VAQRRLPEAIRLLDDAVELFLEASTGIRILPARASF